MRDLENSGYKKYPEYLKSLVVEWKSDRCKRTEDALYHGAQKLVAAVINKYRSLLAATNIETEDAFSIASAAVFMAAEKWSGAGTFLGFCSLTVSREIMRAADTSSGICAKIPAKMTRRVFKVSRELGKPLEPEILPLVEERYDRQTYEEVRRYVLLHSVCSRYAGGTDGEEDMLSGIPDNKLSVEDEVIGLTNDDTIALAESIKKLARTEQIIIMLKHGYGTGLPELTFNEIGKKLCKNPSSVADSYYHGIEHLRALMNVTDQRKEKALP